MVLVDQFVFYLFFVVFSLSCTLRKQFKFEFENTYLFVFLKRFILKP